MAVNHPQAGPPSKAAQWYIAPAVGKALASSAIASATSNVPAATSGHPMPRAAGPPFLMATSYVVTMPVRTLMIEKLTAKLENPPIARRSSWE